MTFKFIGYSSSQMKHHSCWFIATDPHCELSEQIVMDRMGSFNHEPKILKRYARRGQCFSTTTFVAELNPKKVKLNYPDIERNQYCFTDGCGYINPVLANKAAEKFGAT